jgi:peptidoglycan hydrolase CwlO-like protein
MKKLLLVVATLVFVLALGGCTQDNSYSNEEIDLMLQDYESEILQQQEDIEDLENELENQVREILELLNGQYVEYDEEAKRLYTNCMIVDGMKHCDLVLDLNEE